MKKFLCHSLFYFLLIITCSIIRQNIHIDIQINDGNIPIGTNISFYKVVSIIGFIVEACISYIILTLIAFMCIFCAKFLSPSYTYRDLINIYFPNHSYILLGFGIGEALKTLYLYENDHLLALSLLDKHQILINLKDLMSHFFYIDVCTLCTALITVFLITIHKPHISEDRTTKLISLLPIIVYFFYIFYSNYQTLQNIGQ